MRTIKSGECKKFVPASTSNVDFPEPVSKLSLALGIPGELPNIEKSVALRVCSVPHAIFRQWSLAT